jgi:hypothetical protein
VINVRVNKRPGLVLMVRCAGSRSLFALVWLVWYQGIVSDCQEIEEMIVAVGIGHGDSETTDTSFPVNF